LARARASITSAVSTSWSAHFFTGSAPRVIRVQGLIAKNPDILNILFSEPVDAATIDAAILAGVGAKAVGSFVLRGAAYVDKTCDLVGDPYSDGKLTRAILATAWRACNDNGPQCNRVLLTRRKSGADAVRSSGRPQIGA
jgi:hypothetical protein